MPINQILYREYRQNLFFNACVIGWLGNIVSSVMLLCSAMMILHNHAVIIVIMQLLNICDGQRKDDMHLFVENFILCSGTLVYILSLGNILVSTMLLIGVARKSGSFICPWLVYHGVLFGFVVHIAFYVALCNLFVDFTMFVFSVMVLVMAFIIFVKIYLEIFMLVKLLKDEHRRRDSAMPAEAVDAVGVEVRGHVSTV